MRCLLLATALLFVVTAACNSAVCAPDLFLVDGICGTERICPTACLAHEICSGDSEPYACACAPGYEGSPCRWAGVVQNPKFERPSDAEEPTYWDDVGRKGATLVSSDDGPVGGGVGVLLTEVVCAAGGLSQTVEMPTYHDAEPLIATITYRTANFDAFAVGIGRSWKDLPSTDDAWVVPPVEFCLGEGAYGNSSNKGEVNIFLASSEPTANCNTDLENAIRIDHLDIRPDETETCLAPGVVRNGSAEQTEPENDWRYAAEAGIQASLQDDVGENISRGARIFREAAVTGTASMTTDMSIPLPTEDGSPALRFWWTGTSGDLFQVDIGSAEASSLSRRSVDRLTGSSAGPTAAINAGDSVSYCLPPWTHGNVVDLTFSLVDASSSTNTDLVVDNVVVLSEEPTCEGSAELLDPGFESAPGHWLGSYLVGSQNQNVRTQTENVRTGAGALEMEYWTTAPNLAMENFLLIPENLDSEGPQLVFYARVPAKPDADLEMVLGRSDAEVERKPLATGSGWLLNKICLPQEWSGRWFRFQVQASGSDAVIGRKSLYLDDFRLTTSGDCPVAP